MINGVWTKEEIEILINSLGKKRYQEISIILGRNVNSIQKKVIALGLAREIKKTPWTEEEIKLLKSLYGIMRVEQISKRLNRTEDSIKGKAKQLALKGFVENAWTKNELEFLKNNFENMTIKDIAKSLGRTKNAVQLKANRLGLKQTPKYEFNIEYFKNIDCEDKAYWLGFIYADGYVSIHNNGRSHTFGIELKASDDEHLKKFIHAINGNFKITYRKRTCDFKKYKSNVHICSVRIYSITFVKNLIEKGVFLNKTKILEFPKFLPKELMRHFIRGYIDGDGYISFDKRTHGNYGYRTRLGYVCSSKSFAIDLKEFLETELDFENTLVLYKDRNCLNIDTANQKQLLSIINYLYKDSTIYLDRKYDTYKKIHHYLLN